MSIEWIEAYQCKECALVSDNPKVNHCVKCGSSLGHAAVKVKIKRGLFRDKIIDVRIDGDAYGNDYIKRLASLLEIEAGGEEVEYLAEMISVAVLGGARE